MFFFGTMTGLDTQLDVFIYLMNHHFPGDKVRLQFFCALVRRIFEEVASQDVLQDPRLMHA
jgi:hypothetical protein